MPRRGKPFTLRLFVAIPMPPAVQDALERLLDDLPEGKPVDPEMLHLTLAFLGETPPDEAERAHEALGRVRGAPFEVALKGLGCFGTEVLWAGLADPAPVVALHGRVLSALQGHGLTYDRRRYRPHVTLARLDRPDEARLARFLSAHEAFPAPPFTATSFGLYKSTPHKTGSIYEELARYPLGVPSGISPAST